MPHLDKFDGTSIFIDANIFLYVFMSDSRFGDSSYNLISKIEDYQIEGATSPLVITEVIHKLICLEISERFNIKLHKAISYYRKNPSSITKLTKYIQAIKLINSIANLTILELNNNIFKRSYNYIRKYHLLSSDSIHLATCLENNIRDIATNDSDFKRVKIIDVWTPSPELKRI